MTKLLIAPEKLRDEPKRLGRGITTSSRTIWRQPMLGRP